jgi:hypothetical protein
MLRAHRNRCSQIFSEDGPEEVDFWSRRACEQEFREAASGAQHSLQAKQTRQGIPIRSTGEAQRTMLPSKNVRIWETFPVFFFFLVFDDVNFYLEGSRRLAQWSGSAKVGVDHVSGSTPFFWVAFLSSPPDRAIPF